MAQASFNEKWEFLLDKRDDFKLNSIRDLIKLKQIPQENRKNLTKLYEISNLSSENNSWILFVNLMYKLLKDK